MVRSRFIGVALVVTILASCDMIKYKPVDYNTDSTTLSPLAKQKLEERIAKYKSNLEKKCKDKAYQSAIKHVDSLIIEELKLQHIEGTSFPNRPTRPRLPEGIILNDSTEVKAI